MFHSGRAVAVRYPVDDDDERRSLLDQFAEHATDFTRVHIPHWPRFRLSIAVSLVLNCKEGLRYFVSPCFGPRPPKNRLQCIHSTRQPTHEW